MKNSRFPLRLQKALDANNMTQADLCRKTGISTAQMSSYINGKYEPNANNLSLIATILLVSEAWLTGYDDSTEPSNEAFTAHEKKVIFAYRDQPKTQPFVDRLLGIEEPPLHLVPQDSPAQEPAKIAAFDGDNDTVTPKGTYQERKALLKKIEEEQE